MSDFRTRHLHPELGSMEFQFQTSWPSTMLGFLSWSKVLFIAKLLPLLLQPFPSGSDYWQAAVLQTFWLIFHSPLFLCLPA